MGTWGYAIFADDTALDVRDAYRELILTEPGIDDAEATRRVLGDHMDQDDLDTVSWPPPRRKIRLPRMTSLKPGDVLAYQITDGTYLQLRVARIYRNEPVCVLLDFAGPQIPALDDIAGLPDSLWTDWWVPEGRVVPFRMEAHKRVDFAEAGYALVGNIGTRPGDEDVDPSGREDWLTALTASTVERHRGGARADPERDVRPIGHRDRAFLRSVRVDPQLSRGCAQGRRHGAYPRPGQ